MLYLQWRINRMSYVIYRTAPFSMILNDSYPQFQGHAILWRWISHKRYDIHSFNEILIGTYTRPTQQSHFEWSWVTLNDLAKYSIFKIFMFWFELRDYCSLFLVFYVYCLYRLIIWAVISAATLAFCHSSPTLHTSLSSLLFYFYVLWVK